MNAIWILFLIPICYGFDPRLYGEWSLWHSNTKQSLLSNKVLISLYPKRKFEVKEKKQQNIFLMEYVYRGHYKLGANSENGDSGNVLIEQENLRIRMLSICGIGFDELPILCMKNLNKRVKLQYDIISKDDIFLSKYNNHFHLIRHTRINEPPINVPLSTLMLTNIVSIILSHLLHKYVHFDF